MAPEAPRRRCVGCGRVAPKAELVRLALTRLGVDHIPRVVIDNEARMPGRGAYVCRASSSGALRQDCLKQALGRGGVARSLRCTVKLEAADLVDSMSP